MADVCQRTHQKNSQKLYKMSEETTKKELATQNDVVNLDAACETAMNAEVSEMELVSNYFDFEVGESIRVFPYGIRRIEKLNPSKEDWDNLRDGEDKPMTDAVRFLCANDKLWYIAADAVIVSSLKEQALENKKEGTSKVWFEVTCIGENEGKKGKYKKFSIKSLR